MASHAKQKSSKCLNIGRFIARFVLTGEVKFLVLEEVPYIKRSVISGGLNILFFCYIIFRRNIAIFVISGLHWTCFELKLVTLFPV